MLSAEELLQSAIDEDTDPYGWPQDLEVPERLEYVTEEWYGDTRWGTLRLSVFKDTETGKFAGVIHEVAGGEGESPGKDEWDVVSLEAVQTTTYKVVH